MTEYIHGETDPREVARLEKQSHFTAPFILRDFVAGPGQRVLDLATGVGAMAKRIVERFPGILLFGVDRSEPQLAAAQLRHPVACYVRADATMLPFPDGTFDAIHCSWLLEHVREPVAVLTEAHRVLKPGGLCHFTEVDNATFRTVPEFPETVAAMRALDDAQIRAGGDPYVGRILDQLLAEAGFTRIRCVAKPVLGSAADPALFVAFAEEFAEIFESAEEAVGPALLSTMQAAARRLRNLPDVPGSEMHYASVLGQAWR